jgi:HlyD family secretion protein
VIAVISRRGGGIEQRRADEMAITRNEGMIRAKRNELASIRRQRTTQEELVKKGLKAGNTLFQYDSRITATRGEINNLQNQTALLRSRLHSTAEVKSPEAGRVVEVLKSAGDSVAPGQALVRLEAVASDSEQEFCGGKIHALLYVSARVAGKVRSGQVARVSPLDVKREEYGFIVGKVEWMASYAASPDDMTEKLKNRSLVESYSGGGPVFEARVCLEFDPENLANGFKWSSSKGPDRAIGTGGQCSASVVVASKRPYTYVIPTVKKTIGI